MSGQGCSQYAGVLLVQLGAPRRGPPGGRHGDNYETSANGGELKPLTAHWSLTQSHRCLNKNMHVCVCVCRVFTHSAVTVSCSYCSPLPTHPPNSSPQQEGSRRCTCVSALYVCSLAHIILNRIFPSRVLLPPSFRSLPQGSRFSRAGCLFWSVIVPEPQKPWVSTAVTPWAHLPRVAQLLNDCFYVT